jgi:hypothetical protein
MFKKRFLIIFLKFSFSYPFVFSFLIGLFGIAAYSSLYVPHVTEGLTEILTSLSLGNTIRYYFDSTHVGNLPGTTLAFALIACIFSYVFLGAGFRVLKFVSSMNFNNSGTLSAGRYSVRVEGLPKDIKDSKIV